MNRYLVTVEVHAESEKAARTKLDDATGIEAIIDIELDEENIDALEAEEDDDDDLDDLDDDDDDDTDG